MVHLYPHLLSRILGKWKRELKQEWKRAPFNVPFNCHKLLMENPLAAFHSGNLTVNNPTQQALITVAS